MPKRSRLKRVSQVWMDRFADAFYDENYSKMSKMLGKKITNQAQAETELNKQRVVEK